MAFFAGDSIGVFCNDGDSGLADSAVRAANGQSFANFLFSEKAVGDCSLILTVERLA